MKNSKRLVALLLAGALACASAAAETVRWMAETPLQEAGQPVVLEILIDKPDGPGPFPVLVFNHGSTGRGTDPSLFARSYRNEGIAKFFNERGWAVVFPQRRGRGASSGTYDEGFDPDRRRGYSCDPARSLPGLQRAMQDLDAVMQLLPQRKELDTRRMLVGGQSRGGILAVAYAGEKPHLFGGVVNFVGGWIADRCPQAADINHVSFERGARFPGPMIWLYGEEDPFYALDHSRAGFERFRAAGGKGSFQTFRVAAANGHALLQFPDLWRVPLTQYLDSLR